MFKTYKLKTHCKADSPSSKTANIILPGLTIKHRWTPSRVQAKSCSNSSTFMWLKHLISPNLILNTIFRLSNSFQHLVGHESSFLEAYKIPKGTPSAGVLSMPGLEKFAIFNQNLCLSQKWYEIGPWLIWNTNRKS